jgi:hypothetical protein
MRSSSLRRGSAAIVSVLALAQTAATPALARPQVPAEQRHMSLSGDMPACDDPSVLGQISSRFSSREGYWNSGLAIAGFNSVVEVGYRSIGLDYYPRRYCMGLAMLNDGKARKVTYAIGGSETGWLGVLGSGVEWCIEGLDRNFAYGGACRAARP